MKSLRSTVDEVIATIRKNPSYSEATAKEKMLYAMIDSIIEYVDQLPKQKTKHKESV